MKIKTKIKLIHFDFAVENVPESGIICKPVSYASALFSSQLVRESQGKKTPNFYNTYQQDIFSVSMMFLQMATLLQPKELN